LDGKEVGFGEGDSARFSFEANTQTIQIRVFETVKKGGWKLQCLDIMRYLSFEQDFIEKIQFHVEHPLGRAKMDPEFL
jgi:hypothetical protein